MNMTFAPSDSAKVQPLAPAGVPLRVRNLVKRFGAFNAVDDVSFEVPAGKILALLGPSGCGKTTTLRCIAGLEQPSGGEILVGERTVMSAARHVSLAPDKRDMGMVFQSYAIWPHMTVAQNVGYPLKVRKVSSAETTRRVDEILELVGLSGLGGRPASDLSGGQQQRVALARAVIGRPRVLLFDEPLSNLDAKLRTRMRFELVRLQREVGITSVFVTHDQHEAMAMADELVVMNRGRIEQVGDARGLYLNPSSVFVADFIGGANLLEGELVSKPDENRIARLRLASGETLSGALASDAAIGTRLTAVIRPEALRISAGQGGNAVIRAVQYLGSVMEIRASVFGAEVRITADPALQLAAGDRVQVDCAATDCILLPA